MRNILLILTLILCSSMAAAQNETFVSVQKYTERLSDVSDHGDDGIVALQKLSQNVEILIELGRPVSILMKDGVEEDWKPDSDKQRAMSILQQAMEVQLPSSENRPKEISTHANREAVEELGYFDWHVWSFHFLEKDFKSAMSPEFGVRKEYDGTLHRECRSHLSTFFALKMLEGIFNITCKPPSADAQRRYLDIVDEIRQTERAFSEDHSESASERWNIVIIKLKAVIHLFTDDTADEAIRKLREARRITKQKAIYLISDYFRAYSEKIKVDGILPFCRVSSLFDAGDHKRDLINDALLHMAFELKRLLILSTACSNVANFGHAGMMGKFERETAARIVRMADVAVKWAKQAFEMDWPSGPAAFAKHALLREFKDEDIPQTSYNQSAKIVEKEFRERGREGMDYLVLVTRPMTDESDYHVQKDDGSKHTVIEDFLDIDAHILQVNKTHHDSSNIANHSLKLDSAAVFSHFRQLTESHGYSSAKEKMEWLRAQGSVVLGEGFFRNAIHSVLLRQTRGSVICRLISHEKQPKLKQMKLFFSTFPLERSALVCEMKLSFESGGNCSLNFMQISYPLVTPYLEI